MKEPANVAGFCFSVRPYEKREGGLPSVSKLLPDSPKNSRGSGMPFCSIGGPRVAEMPSCCVRFLSKMPPSFRNHVIFGWFLYETLLSFERTSSSEGFTYEHLKILTRRLFYRKDPAKPKVPNPEAWRLSARTPNKKLQPECCRKCIRTPNEILWTYSGYSKEKWKWVWIGITKGL